MNKVFLMGRLGYDPELKEGGGQESTEISIAVRQSKDVTMWIRCTAFDRTAKTICDHLHKGEGIIIEGHLKTNTYTDKDTGKSRTTLQVIADRMEFPTSRGGEGTQAPKDDFFAPVNTDDGDLPF